MALSTAIYTILHNNATVAAVVGTRIYPGIVPENVALPCIVYEIDNIVPTLTNTTDLNLDDCTVTVTVMSTKHADTETYAGYIRTALYRYQGTVDSERVEDIEYQSQSAGYQDDKTVNTATKGVGVFWRQLNFSLKRQA